MTDAVEFIKLRRITKYTCTMSVPSAYMRNHGLQPGDQVLWIPDADGVRLKFGRCEHDIAELWRHGGEVA
jgi:hypothetical protein